MTTPIATTNSWHRSNRVPRQRTEVVARVCLVAGGHYVRGGGRRFGLKSVDDASLLRIGWSTPSAQR